MYKVSVIIPVYNAEKYLTRCLDSVCQQTLKDIEIICVNDCSTDDSCEILKQYKEKYPQLKVVSHQQNGGESKARNTGIDLATGEYIAFLDNDDKVDLDFYEKLYLKAKQENADIAKGEVHIYHYDGRIEDGHLNQHIQTGDKFYFAFHWWTAIYKKEIIDHHHIRLPEGYPLAGDVLFLNQVVTYANKLSLIDDAFYHYYRRKDSGDSQILPMEKIKSAITIFHMIADHLLSLKINTKGIQYNLNAWLIQILFYSFRVREEKTLRYISKSACSYFQKVKKVLNNDYGDILPVIIDFLNQNDHEKLMQFFVKNNSPAKMFVANLRYLHTKKGS